MKKQTAALREVNDSRLKIYEQLEVSIQDLERANHRLVIENTSDKKLIKRYDNVLLFSMFAFVYICVWRNSPFLFFHRIGDSDTKIN